MSGVIDVRYNYKEENKSKSWTAKPRFGYYTDKEGKVHDIRNAIGMASSSYMALAHLSDQCPAEMANRIRLHIDNTYPSPEADFGSIDRCLDVDGYKPSRAAWQDRRKRYNWEKHIREICDRAHAKAMAEKAKQEQEQQQPTN